MQHVRRRRWWQREREGGEVPETGSMNLVVVYARVLLFLRDAKRQFLWTNWLHHS
jgi:hypothetical protein